LPAIWFRTWDHANINPEELESPVYPSPQCVAEVLVPRRARHLLSHLLHFSFNGGSEEWIAVCREGFVVVLLLPLGRGRLPCRLIVSLKSVIDNRHHSLQDVIYSGCSDRANEDIHPLLAYPFVLCKYGSIESIRHREMDLLDWHSTGRLGLLPRRRLLLLATKHFKQLLVLLS